MGSKLKGLKRSSPAVKLPATFQRRIARALLRRDGGTDAALLALAPELEAAGLPNEAQAVRALVSRAPLHVKRHT